MSQVWWVRKFEWSKSTKTHSHIFNKLKFQHHVFTGGAKLLQLKLPEMHNFTQIAIYIRWIFCKWTHSSFAEFNGKLHALNSVFVEKNAKIMVDNRSFDWFACVEKFSCKPRLNTAITYVEKIFFDGSVDKTTCQRRISWRVNNLKF